MLVYLEFDFKFKMRHQKFFIEKTSLQDPRYVEKLEEISGIFNEAFPWESFSPNSIGTELLTYKASGIYVAREAKTGIAVGSSIWHEYPEYSNQPLYWLQAIKRSFRRNKVGSKLMQRTLGDLAGLDYREVYLITYTGFRGMIRYCIEHGWKRVKLFPKSELVWGPYDRAILLKYELLSGRSNGHQRIEEIIARAEEIKEPKKKDIEIDETIKLGIGNDVY
jgi:hypothetical protein